MLSWCHRSTNSGFFFLLFHSYAINTGQSIYVRLNQSWKVSDKDRPPDFLTAVLDYKTQQWEGKQKQKWNLKKKKKNSQGRKASAGAEAPGKWKSIGKEAVTEHRLLRCCLMTSSSMGSSVPQLCISLLIYLFCLGTSGVYNSALCSQPCQRLLFWLGWNGISVWLMCIYFSGA